MGPCPVCTEELCRKTSFCGKKFGRMGFWALNPDRLNFVRWRCLRLRKGELLWDLRDRKRIAGRLPAGCSTARLNRDDTLAETRFGLSAKRTSPFNWRGLQFSLLLAAEVCASAVLMLDTPCSEVECKTTGYPLHSHVSPSLPLPCVTVCHQVSTQLYRAVGLTAEVRHLEEVNVRSSDYGLLECVYVVFNVDSSFSKESGDCDFSVE